MNRDQKTTLGVSLAILLVPSPFSPLAWINAIFYSFESSSEIGRPKEEDRQRISELQIQIKNHSDSMKVLLPGYFIFNGDFRRAAEIQNLKYPSTGSHYEGMIGR